MVHPVILWSEGVANVLDKMRNTAIAEDSGMLDNVDSYTALSDYYRSFCVQFRALR